MFHSVQDMNITGTTYCNCMVNSLYFMHCNILHTKVDNDKYDNIIEEDSYEYTGSVAQAGGGAKKIISNPIVQLAVVATIAVYAPAFLANISGGAIAKGSLLSRAIVSDYFPSMSSRISGIGVIGIEKKIKEKSCRDSGASEFINPNSNSKTEVALTYTCTAFFVG